MSRNNAQTKKFDSNDDEDKFSIGHKSWNYPDRYSHAQQYQNRTCCSPVDEIDTMDSEDDNVNVTHNVEVQTEKSSFQLKQERRPDDHINKTNNVPTLNGKENVGNKRMHFVDNASQGPINELQHVKLKKTGLSLDYQKITEKLVSKINTPEVFDEYTEPDLDQPMDFTLCYSETNLYEEKKQNLPNTSKNDFSSTEEVVEEEKNEAVKSKGFLSKESRIKKEMFGNTSRSFKEIFNFFKDRDKKRIENPKGSLPEGTKFIKTNDTSDQKSEKSSQHSQQSVEQVEKETKSKNETHCSQPTPLMFSRCSSLGSLTGFEQNSINDDRSSIISDISRRTSGVISPSELPDSPVQIAPPGKVQSKSQIGCFGKKKIPMIQQEKLKVGQCSAGASENFLQNSENCFKKPLVMKRSVFEDNITAFKDESTPTKIHSMTASSLSSLTIDDDDDYEIINKIIINKEKENIPEESEIKEDNRVIVDNSNVVDSSTNVKKNEDLSGEPDENCNEEENDELTDLTPYQEQLLDECIRRGIAKLTKQHFDEIKPFSWDLGLTCRATRAMLIRRFKIHLDKDFQNNFFSKTPYNLRNQTLTINKVTRERSPEDENDNNSYEKYLNQDSDSPASNLDEANNKFDENSYYISYEEHLLDECIRRGMAKITKRNINDIRPFSWDANQICLTTRVMMLHGRDKNVHGNH